MLVFAWLSVATLGAVFLGVCAILAAVEITERRRALRVAMRLALRPVRRGFRPVIIEGGRQNAPAADAPDKLAG